jgi:predicted metal-dependent hydrolase
MTGKMMLDVEGIGSVLLERSERARKISIRISPSGVKLVIPANVPPARGMEFLSMKKEWIRRHVDRIDCITKEHRETAKVARPITDMKHARNKIVSRLYDLSERYDLPFERVMIRNQKTRWGSCSARNAISLNIKLARLPEDLMDYVILHELAHTKIKGHDKRFWNLLGQISKDALKLRKELRRYSPVTL